MLRAKSLEETCRVVNGLASEIRGQPAERGKDACLRMARNDGLERAALYLRMVIKDVKSYKFDASKDFEPGDSNDPDTWFKPLRDVIVALSRAYGVLKAEVFDDLAKQAVGELIGKVELGAGAGGGKAWAVANLLRTREQLAPFRVEFRSVDRFLTGGDVSTAAKSLIQNRRSLFAIEDNALIGFAQGVVGQVEEVEVDLGDR